MSRIDSIRTGSLGVGRNRASQAAVLISSLVIVVAVWMVDRSVSEQVRFYAIYLLPIGITAWYCGRVAAVALSLLAVGLWAFGDPEMLKLLERRSSPFFWNVGMRLCTFVGVSLVMGRLRAAFNHEREMARTDQVTGAPNRHRFVEAAEIEITRARRYGRPFAVAYLDVDNFKLLNDRLGHDVGDEVLRVTAQTIAADLRDSDTVARIGGDEFVVLFPETDARTAGEVAERLRGKLLEHAGKAGWPITYSIGVVDFHKPPASAEELLRLADEQMYSIKRAGKNAVSVQDYGG